MHCNTQQHINPRLSPSLLRLCLAPLLSLSLLLSTLSPKHPGKFLNIVSVAHWVPTFHHQETQRNSILSRAIIMTINSSRPSSHERVYERTAQLLLTYQGSSCAVRGFTDIREREPQLEVSFKNVVTLVTWLISSTEFSNSEIVL